jgi:hypothetical protein
VRDTREEIRIGEGTKDTTGMNRYPSFVTAMRHDSTSRVHLPAQDVALSMTAAIL